VSGALFNAPDHLLGTVPHSSKFCRSAQAVKSVREGLTASLQLGFKPDSFDPGLWLRHEFPNRFKDDPKLGVVLLLQLIEASGKPLVRSDHLSKLNNLSHDGDVCLHRALESMA